ncbi:MAG TPA: hypothetical protein PKD55_18330 [Bellilinea sp.]|nr:hypothetical protein [Bellilinea sp.]
MPEIDPQEILAAVKQNRDYAQLSNQLILNIIAAESGNAKSKKDLIKSVRSKLHQVGNAYYPQSIDYAQLISDLESLPPDPDDDDVKANIVKVLGLHASTRERLPFYMEMMETLLDSIGAFTSIQDLACGFNPLAYLQFPQLRAAKISACDIYSDQIAYLNSFFRHFGMNAEACLCDLSSEIPTDHNDVTLLFKTIPCLEQLDKQIGRKLLASLNTEHLVATFPVASLSGKSKGMRENYAAHFRGLIDETMWRVRRFDFPGELAFVLSRRGVSQ